MASSRGPSHHHRGGGVDAMTRRPPDPSSEVFRGSIEYLIEYHGGGIAGRRQTAAMWGVTERTVSRWERGETQPSRARRESARRRSLDRGRTQAVQVRVGGRFSPTGTLARPSSLRGRETINQELQRIRRAELRAARRRPLGPSRDRAVRAAEMLPTHMTGEEALDLFNRLQELQDDPNASNADWRAWEDDYEAWKRGLRSG